LLGAVVALGAVAPVVAGQAPQGAGAGLVGRWRLNPKESEDPRAKFRPRPPGEGPGGVSSRDGEPPRGAGEGIPGRTDATVRPQPHAPGASPEPLKAPPGLDEFLDAPTTLTIGVADLEVTFGDGTGASLTLPSDGSAQKLGLLTRAARWEGSSLVVETTNAGGAQLMTRYNPMAGERKIEVYARLAGKDGHVVTLRRVYEPDEPVP
jgi:hypothetical protein